MPEINTLNPSTQLSSYLKDYSYQTELTKELDNLKGDFDYTNLLEIALWKVDRYFRLEDDLLQALNEMKLLKNGQHHKAQLVLHRLLEQEGVDIAMASTILRFRNPEVFQIIDKRAYRVLYGEKMKLYFTTPITKKISVYFEYLDKLNGIKEKVSVDFKLLDRVLYQLDKEINRDIKL